MNLELPATVASAQDLAGLITEIRQFSQWYLHEIVKQKVGSKKTAGNTEPEISEAARVLLQKTSAGKPLSRQDFDTLIKGLETFQKQAPAVTFTLAAPATGAVKQKLVTWCRQNIAPTTLVSFQHNSTILGGLVMRYKSRVYDWSFRRAILENAQKFPEVLRRV